MHVLEVYWHVIIIVAVKELLGDFDHDRVEPHWCNMHVPDVEPLSNPLLLLNELDIAQHELAILEVVGALFE